MLMSQSSVDQENELNVVRLGLEFPAAAANALEDMRRKFTNQRQWREFVSALQCTANYPAAVANTLRAGRKWFNYRFSR
jgi:hypothetical protein